MFFTDYDLQPWHIQEFLKSLFLMRALCMFLQCQSRVLMIAFQLFPSQCVMFGIWLNATIINKNWSRTSLKRPNGTSGFVLLRKKNVFAVVSMLYKLQNDYYIIHWVQKKNPISFLEKDRGKSLRDCSWTKLRHINKLFKAVN